MKNIDALIQRLQAMSPEERDQISLENVRSSELEHDEFLEAFHAGDCYLCGRPLLTFSSGNPCLHWLLKPKGFKKHDLPSIAAKHGFFQIQTYLRWVANTAGYGRNINDLAEEGTGKLIEITIRYKQLEWSFSCGESDYRGHTSAAQGREPHYHFQMRIDRRPFVDYNDFHLPFSEEDLVGMSAKLQLPGLFRHAFPRGEGMADILNDDTVEALVRAGTSDSNEDEAPLKLDTIVMADEGTTIKGEELHAIIEEAKRTGVTISSLMHKLKNVRTQVYVTPGPGVVEQAPRSALRKKKKGA